MRRRIPDAELRRLRNDVPINAVLDDLGIPCKIRDGYTRFICPRCGDSHTFTNARTNLACCMSCRTASNPIDLVMQDRQLDFLEAVDYLRRHEARIRGPGHRLL